MLAEYARHYNGHWFLPAIGDPWTTQDLSQNYGTPQTQVTPTAVVHDAGATGAGCTTCGTGRRR